MMRGAVIAFWAMSLLVACKEQEVAAPEEPRSVVSEQVNPLAGFGETFLGEVSSRDESVLGFPIAGTMAVRSVEAGTLVEAGQTLALMDPTELDAEVRSAEAAITVAKSELNNATDAASRKKILFGKGVDTQGTSEKPPVSRLI